MSESVLYELEKVSFAYSGKQPLIKDFSLTIKKGELITLLGANGSGKSTLLKLLCGLLFPLSGRLYFKGYLINETAFRNDTFNRNFRSRVGMCFQNPTVQLFCPSVWEELLFAPLQLGLGQEQASERAREISGLFQLDKLSERAAYSLSGGEQKKVAIASVLTANPSVLILDEPLSGLDPRSRVMMIELIAGLHKAGKTIIIATHLLELADHLKSRSVVLSEDHFLLKDAAAAEVLADRDVLLKANLIANYPGLHFLEH